MCLEQVSRSVEDAVVDDDFRVFEKSDVYERREDERLLRSGGVAIKEPDPESVQRLDLSFDAACIETLERGEE